MTLTPADFGITDPDDSAFTFTLSGISGGQFELTTAPGVPITSFTSAQLAASQVVFVDNGDEVAPAFSVTVNDGDVDSNTLAASITYTPANDAPVLNTASLSVTEGQTVTLTGAGQSPTILVRIEGEHLGAPVLGVRRGAKLVDVLNHLQVDPTLADAGAIHLRRNSVAVAQRD